MTRRQRKRVRGRVRNAHRTTTENRMSLKNRIPTDAPPSSGKTNLTKHFAGVRLTQRQGILAKCCECMGYYRDGRVDCGSVACPLYPWMPYRANSRSKRGGGGRSAISGTEQPGEAPDGGSVESGSPEATTE